MISNKRTLERVENLQRLVMALLQSFQIGRFAEIHELGIIDVPLFGLRFRFVELIKDDDTSYQIIDIPNEDFLDEDKLFITLCTKGYIHWLREHLGSHAFMMVLSYKDRWNTLVSAAIEKAQEEKKGEYLIRYFESFLERPFMDIYHEDPTVFDWMLT